MCFLHARGKGAEYPVNGRKKRSKKVTIDRKEGGTHYPKEREIQISVRGRVAKRIICHKREGL